MRTLDDLLEPLLGLDGRPAPFAGPLRDLLRDVVTRLDTHLDQRAAQVPTDLYLRGQDLIGRLRTVCRVPGRQVHRAVQAELDDAASPLRVPLWSALGDLAGQLIILLHRDGPRQREEADGDLVLGLVGVLLGLTHPAPHQESRREPPAAVEPAEPVESVEPTAPVAAPVEETGRRGPGDLTVRLRDEYDRLYQDSVVYLGEPDEAPETAEELWIGLHVACLRLPEAIARFQREHFARTFGGEPGEAVVPALPAIGFPGLGDPKGPGGDHWRSARTERMYDILVEMFAVAELDPGVYHGLDEMARDAQAPIRLDAETRRQYRERAWTRLRELDELQPGSDLEIRYLAWVDEVVSSFFPLPLPVPDSWWAERYRRSRALVLDAVRAAGGKADVLDGRPYDRALRGRLSGTQMIMPVEEADADRVLWTLRLPWEFGGSGEPGRVVHGVRRR
ncbi:hypothetical protein [Streptosporangium sp. NPDC020145]|uniref:hypothetical protein n=1 Tax=Streptosporangium sp. NPDC020145 TaxID=3154694 RepID=UPI0034247363